MQKRLDAALAEGRRLEAAQVAREAPLWRARDEARLRVERLRREHEELLATLRALEWEGRGRSEPQVFFVAAFAFDADTSPRVMVITGLAAVVAFLAGVLRE
jgi:hypothetical protein